MCCCTDDAAAADVVKDTAQQQQQPEQLDEVVVVVDNTKEAAAATGQQQEQKTQAAARPPHAHVLKRITMHHENRKYFVELVENDRGRVLKVFSIKLSIAAVFSYFLFSFCLLFLS